MLIIMTINTSSSVRLDWSLSTHFLFKCAPDTDNILQHTRQIQTVREFYSRPKSDVVEHPMEYETKLSLNKTFLNTLVVYDNNDCHFTKKLTYGNCQISILFHKHLTKYITVIYMIWSIFIDKKSQYGPFCRKKFPYLPFHLFKKSQFDHKTPFPKMVRKNPVAIFRLL